jgi:TctA family transporter
VFLERPIGATFLAIAAIMLISPLFSAMLGRNQTSVFKKPKHQ